MATTKFDPIRQLVAELEARAAKLDRIKVDTTVGSHNDVMTQLTALKAYLRRVKLQKFVTCKVGLWYKKMPLVDVVIDFKGLDYECKTGAEAGELAKLMERSFALVRQIMAHGLPKMNAYCPEVGVVCNGWRFQC